MINIPLKGDFKPFNDYKIQGDTTIIFSENRKHRKFEFLIDTEDLPKLIELDRYWHAVFDPQSGYYYPRTNIRILENGKEKKTVLYLHRFVVNADEGTTVDHIHTEETLNSKKNNLRITNKSVNAKNRTRANKNSKTGIKNVCYLERDNEYWVQFCDHGKRYCWKFPSNKFQEACDFAEKKREEIFGKREEMHIVDAINNT